MKISVMANGMVKVEGSTLAEEVEMRNKLQAQGKTCTPIEYEGSVQDCLDWIMGKSESELDEVEDNGVYVLTDEDGQKLEIEIDEVINHIEENFDPEPECLDWVDMKRAVENYLCDKPEITGKDFIYLTKSGQIDDLTDEVYWSLC